MRAANLHLHTAKPAALFAIAVASTAAIWCDVGMRGPLCGLALIERQISARRCCRIFVFLLTLAIITRPFVLQYDYTWDPWLAPLLYLLIGATGATFARHVQILFQRAHDERNMKYTRVMMMVFAFASLQSFVVSLFQVVSQEATWPQGDSVLVLISILLTVDMFVMFGALMFGIVLLKDLRGVLARDGGR